MKSPAYLFGVAGNMVLNSVVLALLVWLLGAHVTARAFVLLNATLACVAVGFGLWTSRGE